MAKKPPVQRFFVEHLRKASVWSDNVLLEITEDDTDILVSMTQEGQALSMRLTKEQWWEIREQWNQSM